MRYDRIIRPLGVALLAFAVFAGDCTDDLLETENPGQVTEDALGTEEALPVLVDGAFGDLQATLDEMVIVTGLLTDELIHSGSFSTWREIDNRAIPPDNGEILDQYSDTQTARFSADQAVSRIEEALDDAASSPLLAEALAWAGHSRLLLADNWCQLTIQGGGLLSTQEVYQQALERFDRAIQVAQAAGAEDILNLARVGKARAQLNLGDNGGAAATAQQVPADFEFFIEFSENSSREENDVVIFTVDRRESALGAPFANNPAIPQCSNHDSRAEFVPLCDDLGIGAEPTSQAGAPIFVQLKYRTRGDNIRIASGEEADLIAREAMGEDVEEERMIALFLEAKRLGFMRRNNHPFLAGGEACFPIPEREEDTNENL